MRTDRIDFISAYCDRWCQRCPFTSRCSVFAAECAIAMCGDASEGLELVFGTPRAPEADARPAAEPDWPADPDDTPPSDEEIDQYRREEEARSTRIHRLPLMQLAFTYAMLAHRWLEAERETWGPSADPVVREATDVISWDHTLISAKLYRALRGCDQRLDDRPIQNDWNGSAKVALISIERSEAAWRAIAHATGGDVPLMMADHLGQLRAAVEQAFPDARRFVRPGFDQESPED